MTSDPIRSLERSTLRERALDALRGRVISGRLEPGYHLSEVDLAASFGISRGTVREALRHLQQEGLVVADARGRLRVRGVSGAEVVALYEVRTALESLAVRRVMSLTGDERARAVVRLDEALRQLQATAGDVPAQVEADLALHQTLCEVSGNPILVTTWQGIEGLVRATIYRSGPEEALVAMGPDRHREIIDALARLTPDEAVALLEHHMQEASDRLRAALEA